MAKVVSIVPKLLTSTLALATAAPKKTVPALPAPIVAALPVTEATADKPAAAVSVTGPDLSDDLDPIEARGRGRTGTITTSFRGVLSDAAASLPRRTLLGE